MATNRELELNRQAKLDALEQHLIGLINAYQSINCKLDEIREQLDGKKIENKSTKKTTKGTTK